MSDYALPFSDEDEIFESYLQAEEIEREYAQRLNKLSAAYRAEWPRACPTCGGWAGLTARQSHPYGSTFAVETYWEPCEDRHEFQCHRCGDPGMISGDGDGICAVCGFDPSRDSGDPAYAG